MNNDDAMMVVNQHPRLRQIVLHALQDNARESKRKVLCAAHLYEIGFLDRLPVDMGGVRDDDEIVNTHVRAAVHELKSVGIITPGILGWFVLQFVLLPYLGRLIREWVFGYDE